MRLSEAILKGSEGRTQCTGAYSLPDGRVCAIGAARLGANMPRLGLNARVYGPYHRCPLERCVNSPELRDPISMAVHFNDEHNLSFLEVAANLVAHDMDKELTEKEL